MLWVFSAAGLAGIVCGVLFRASVLVLLSFLSFGASFVFSLLAGMTMGRGLITAILLTGCVQLGYLLGAACKYLWRRIAQRFVVDRDIRRFDGPARRAGHQPLPHR
jgi:hypothetical protein